MSRPAKPPKPPRDAHGARRIVADLLARLLGSRPRRVQPLGGGLTNWVFGVRHPEGDLVVRMSPDPGKVKDFLKEQWAICRAREEGVPVPEVLEVGAAPLPHMIARHVPGTEATHHPERFAVLRELGRHARAIHRIDTVGFGNTFDWSGNLLSRQDSWKDYLTREFQGLRRLEILAAQDMLTPAAIRRIKATLREIAQWDPKPVLNHGDLRLKNVLVGEKGRIAAVIDWEFCTSNAAPYWDMALALHDLSVDAKEEFLAGYGLTPKQMQESAPALRAFNVLNYAQAVSQAAEEKDKPTLDRLRARLQGALDLYAF